MKLSVQLVSKMITALLLLLTIQPLRALGQTPPIDQKVYQICNADRGLYCRTSKTFNEVVSCLKGKMDSLSEDCKTYLGGTPKVFVFPVSNFKGICLEKIKLKCSSGYDANTWVNCFQDSLILEACREQLMAHDEGVNILCKKDLDSLCKGIKDRKSIDTCLLKSKSKLSANCLAYFTERSKQITTGTDNLRQACAEQIQKFCPSGQGKKIDLNDCAAKQPFFGECKEVLKKLRILK